MKKKIIKKVFGIISLCALGVSLSACAFACKPKVGTVYRIFPTYVSQADNLLALGIVPDYYPTQVFWDKHEPYPYINALKPHTFQSFIYQDEPFKNGLTNKLASLEKRIKVFAPSWFSLSGNNDNENRNEEFWFFNKGNFILYDQYLLEDTNNVIGGAVLDIKGGPIKNDSFVTGVDYKTSRDLFLSLPFELIAALHDADKAADPLIKKLKQGLTYEDPSINKLYQLHNFSRYANDINQYYFHNKQNLTITNNNQQTPFNFWTSNFAKFVLGVEYDTQTQKLINHQNEIPLFYPEYNWRESSSLNSKIYHFFNEILLTEKDKKAGINNINYHPQMCDYDNFTKDLPLCTFDDQPSNTSSVLHHHPVYEQNLKLNDSSQIYLGSMRESMLYLYKIAYAATSFIQTKQGQALFKDNPEQKSALENALSNANLIAGNLYERLRSMRLLFQKLGLVDPNYDPQKYNFDNRRSKVLGLLTTFERNGTNTLQSISKYGFLYYDLGFRGPKPRLIGYDYRALLDPVDNKVPEGCHKHDDGTTHCVNEDNEEYELKRIKPKLTNSILNMDAHGWWWNLGDGGLTETNFAKFKGNFDYIFNLTKNKAQVFSNPSENVQVNLLLKSHIQKKTVIDPEVLSNHVFLQDYTLWTEGIRSPIGYNQILDAVLDMLWNTDEVQGQIKTMSQAQQTQLHNQYKQAMHWGSYWDQYIMPTTNTRKG
ncbi:iron ABC transporter substrate-binding protein [Ureaplasma miroungigenitalium]|uniref:Iron ABC transporter substrate-binding protein n=1 Tax=Ureaplasma miroungigenitalium TaxID=1042321 RepID=A0ABT3BLV2_9BACT|nr:iron ABC transporter substrate-binding protein [Ureaplasma miroungigenitalium]MCV3728243.1 iron ABC transporter substrate-binding protein [Ureaplasma miroungigenitalium]